MVRKVFAASLGLTVLIVLAAIRWQPAAQVPGAKKIVANRESAGTAYGPVGGFTPAAFLVVDIWPGEEGGISVSWSDLGSNFVYIVEFCHSLTERNWSAVPPTGQWPTSAKSWTDNSVSGSGTRFYRIKTEALLYPPSPPSEVEADVDDGKVVISWSGVPGASSYNIYWSNDEKFTPLEANKIEGVRSPFTHTILAYGVSYYYVVTAVGNKGESEVSSVVSATPVSSLDTTVATTMAAASEFLYTGDNPIQTGVAEGTIEPKRVAVLRGKVVMRDEKPLEGVKIAVLSHPEFGQTLSREDGMFDMAVNGGGVLTVSYQKESYLPDARLRRG